MTIDYVSVTKEFYESHADAYAQNTATMFDEEWLEKFSSYVKSGGRILDVGCASGRDAGWFVSRGFEVEGVDISPTLIEIARKSVPKAHFRVMDLRKLEYPADSFDGIWCSCVLLHIARVDAPAVVNSMANILRSQGVIYILVKEGNSEGLEKDPRYDGAEKFSSYFEIDEIRSMLEEAGLDILEISDTHERVDEYRASERIFALARKR